MFDMRHKHRYKAVINTAKNIGSCQLGIVEVKKKINFKKGNTEGTYDMMLRSIIYR